MGSGLFPWWTPYNPHASRKALRKALILRIVSEDHRNLLTKLFKERSVQVDAEPYWTEAVFASFLTENLAPIPGSERSCTIIYKSALYHGSYPFAQPSEAKLLDCDSFIIAMYMMTGLEQNYFGQRCSYTGICKRQRTEHDRVRLMFQSLATGVGQVDNAKLSQIFGGPNTDLEKNTPTPETRTDDDDRDLLDVLYATRRRSRNRKIGCKRTSFRPVALALPSSQSRRLGGFISNEDMQSLLLFLIPLSLGPYTAQPSLLESLHKEAQDSAICLFKAFHTGKDTERISWRNFEDAVSESMPKLFNGLAWLLRRQSGLPQVDTRHYAGIHPGHLSIAELGSDLKKGCEPPPTNDRILNTHHTLPYRTILDVSRLSQLSLFIELPGVCIKTLKLVYSTQDNPPRGTTAFSQVLKQPKAPVIALVSSTTTDAHPERLVFGAFLQGPWPHFGNEHCQHADWQDAEMEHTLFQLSPIHKVFKNQSLGQGPRAKPDGTLCLGGARFTFQLDAKLETGWLTHGCTSTAFRVDDIELWELLGRVSDEYNQHRGEWLFSL